jgi:hypothetical protein
MTENRQFHKFIIITIIVPSAHDSCYSPGERFRSCPIPTSSSCCPADLHVLNGFVTVRASCSTPNSSQAWTSASKSDRWLRRFRLQTLAGFRANGVKRRDGDASLWISLTRLSLSRRPTRMLRLATSVGHLATDKLLRTQI